MTKQPKYRRPLNTNQLQTLQLLFKFRYLTAPLLSVLTHKTRRAAQKNLQVLEEQQYIGKKYDTSYRIQGKQAIYYLLPKGIDELRDRYSYNDSVLRVMRRNSSVGEGFMGQHLSVVKAYINFRESYKSTFNIFTKYELAKFSYFIKPLPDLYLSRKEKSQTEPNDFVLDIYADTPTFVIKNRINSYFKHYHYADWQTTTKTPYPVVLISCPSQRVENKIQEYADKKIDSLKLYTTTTKALLDLRSNEIWSDIYEQEELISLGR